VLAAGGLHVDHVVEGRRRRAAHGKVQDLFCAAKVCPGLAARQDAQHGQHLLQRVERRDAEPKHFQHQHFACSPATPLRPVLLLHGRLRLRSFNLSDHEGVITDHAVPIFKVSPHGQF